MASVTLTTVWVHLAATQATYVTFDAQKADEAADRPVSISRYAGGRVRSIVHPGTARVVNVAAAKISRTTADQLRDWVGETVMFRDPFGRKIFGVYDTLNVSEKPGYTRPDVTFTLRETTWTEEV